MTSAAVALREERGVVREPVALEVVESAPRSGFSARFAIVTIAAVQVAWLVALGYGALTILR